MPKWLILEGLKAEKAASKLKPHRELGNTIRQKNIETNDKFYRKVAFLMYTEMINFRPQS